MCMMYESYEIGCVDYCIAIYVPIVLWRKGPVWHGRSAKTVLYIYIYWEEGTRMARAECEDGDIYIHILGGRDPYGTGGVRRRCYTSY